MQDTLPIPAMLVAFTVTIAFMLALRPLAAAAGLLDRPGGRKSHLGDVPIIGGIAMFVGIFVGLTLLSGIDSLIITSLAASFLIVVVGILDDKFGLSAGIRLAIQVSAILIMFYGTGYRLLDIGDPFGIGVISTGPLALAITTLVSITVINAYNLIDGADGLAGSLSLIALLSISFVAGHGDPTTGVALTVCAAVFGFLIFNFPVSWNRPVRSFMGDAGSTLLGFTIVWVTIGASQGESRLVSPVVALWFAAIPIYDLLTCFMKRIRSGKSPLTPGRDHFHHVLNRGAPQHRLTMVILTSLQLVYAGVGLVGHLTGVPDWVMFVGWSVLGLTQLLIIRRIASLKRLLRLRRRRTLRATTATG